MPQNVEKNSALVRSRRKPTGHKFLRYDELLPWNLAVTAMFSQPAAQRLNTREIRRAKFAFEEQPGRTL